MRVAIFSDVHGNLTALQAVLDDIDAQEGVDEVIFAGDLCLGGPRPQACLDLVRERALPSVVGNTDQWILQPPPVSSGMNEAERARWSHVAAVCSWTKRQLDHDSLDWLDDLSTVRQRIVSPAAKPPHDLLVVHANPHDLSQIIFPPLERQQALYGSVRQPDEDLDRLLEGLTASVLAFGHLHVPSVRKWRDRLLVNVSSVSLAGDGDPRAKYALLSWEEGWAVEHFYVDVDWTAEADALRRLEPPGWEDAVAKIARHGYVPQLV